MRRLWPSIRCAMTLAVMLCAASAGAAAPDRSPPLGLCPAETQRLDSYMQLLCEGETALREGRTNDALARFRAAAVLPRLDATHELAWAGLAAAHCRAQDAEQARQWATHFTQARRLWLGELDCEAPATDARARISPFVRSRMCSETLAADYVLARERPQAGDALDLNARLAKIAQSVERVCASVPKMVKVNTSKPKPKASAKKKSRNKKRAAR